MSSEKAFYLSMTHCFFQTFLGDRTEERNLSEMSFRIRIVFESRRLSFILTHKTKSPHSTTRVSPMPLSESEARDARATVRNVRHVRHVRHVRNVRNVRNNTRAYVVAQAQTHEHALREIMASLFWSDDEDELAYDDYPALWSDDDDA
jgi:hypothetical protein